MTWKRHYQKDKRRTRSIDRLHILTVAFFLFVVAITYRLFDLQVLRHGFYEALASSQHDINSLLTPERGEIFVRDRSAQGQLYPVGANKGLSIIYAIPKQVKDAPATAEKLASALDIDQAEIQPRLEKSEDSYEPIKRQVDDETLDKIKKLDLPGIEYSKESVRYYPEGRYFSQLLGFVGYQGDVRAGQYGLEGYFDKELAGQPGYFKAQTDASGRWITVGDTKLEEAVNGSDLVLTIDRTVQYTVCTKVANAVKKHGADAGSAIVMDPKTGAIIAMCGYPDFDPNKYNEVESPSVYFNRSVYQQYEPGSVFKPITMAAALNEGAVGPDTTFVDTGSLQVGKYTIRNADNKTYGEQNMTQVLENSINTGAIFAEQKTGNEKFSQYVEQFGFGRTTGITLSSESGGDISSLEKNKDIYSFTGSFGQGITVTPLQLVTAYAAIANGGKLMKPYVVDEIIKDNGYEEKTEPTVVRQVISPKTAATLGAMLVRVVENGHGKQAGVSGYYIAGKTGTAQIPYTDRPGYDPNRTIGTFAGFGPVEDPAFVMVVKLDVPRDVIWAESSAAPLFGDIAKFLLNYYEVPPTRTDQK
ncbi:MAG: penicillin-binding protein 2 [Patescibacteria group bacterium]|jgi:cell division protein FtsI/penicillin-binding protein 2